MTNYPYLVSSTSFDPLSLSVDLSVSFAQKYMQQMKGASPEVADDDRFAERRRTGMAKTMLDSLRSVSAKSWTKTDNLLAKE